MARKLSVSARQEKLRSVTSDDIKGRTWTESELRAVRRIAARQAAGDDSGINYDDIPRLTDEQLKSMVPFKDR